jgi:MoaA/NifB/PqqE/SkfB family radical SAM enzyme
MSLVSCFDINDIFNVDLTPELLDISIIRKCNFKCIYCYQDSSINKEDMLTLNDIKWLIKFMDKDAPYEVAIGGGEPLLHPEFNEIIREFYINKIIPSITTNGSVLLNENKHTHKIIDYINTYCGGIAITYHYLNDEYKELFHKLIKITTKIFDIQKNIHFIFIKNSIPILEDFLKKYGAYFDEIVLLELHTKGRASNLNNLKPTRNDVEELFELFNRLDDYYLNKISFGASLTPIILEYYINHSDLDIQDIFKLVFNKEALFSGYIDENLILYPSSFHTEYGVKLKNFNTFKEAFNSKLFKSIRQNQFKLRSKCPLAYICNGCVGECSDLCTIQNK